MPKAEEAFRSIASIVRLDKFVYAPNKGAGSIAIEASRGAFRFVSGSQGTGAYQVKTAYSTLGVRGSFKFAG